MEEQEVRGGFKPLGRKKQGVNSPDRLFNQKQKERNRIEGQFGLGKEHYGLDCIRYHGEEGSEIWVRVGILGMNLKTAMARM